MSSRTVMDCLTDGGVPDHFTKENLDWLAKAHRDMAQREPRRDRAGWHARWALLIKDVLESRYGSS